MAYGNEAGIVIVDIVQKISLLNIGSPDLYGAQDPYSRAPRSPKRSDAQGAGPEARSPSIDQVSDGGRPAHPPHTPTTDPLSRHIHLSAHGRPRPQGHQKPHPFYHQPPR